MRIGSMIPNLTSHDAIGNDVVGMYRAIKAIAIDAYVFHGQRRIILQSVLLRHLR
jgi:hypothetical protein